MGIDNKYGQVIVSGSTIAEDEPVVVFRAQDKMLPDLLKIYKILCKAAGSPKKHLDLIHESAEQIRAWQAENFTQVPQSVNYKPEG